MKGSTEHNLALTLMQEEIAASDLLPEAHARYRPLLADGLRFFLERLSPGRLDRILEEQMNLPGSASTAERLVALLHHIPALHKLGQVVARDRRLNVSFRRRLQLLESITPRTSSARVVQLLEREFKHWRKTGMSLDTVPLAEGSVAVILPFTWTSKRSPPSLPSRGNWRDTPASGRQGVFKLLKPGIQGLLEEDLELLGSLGDFLDEDCRRYHLPALDYRETFDTIRDLLLHEVRLDEEQKHLTEAANLYPSSGSVVVPALFPFCTPRLTVMERILGAKIGNGSLPRGLSRRRLARSTAQALVTRPLFSSHPAALFHADPHAGNLLVTPEGKLGLLDWSLVGRLRKEDRVQLVQLLLGALMFDADRMAHAVEALARKPPDSQAVREVLRSGLRKLFWGALPGLSWLIALLDELVVHANVQFASDLLLFRKSLLTLEGVLADLLHEGDAAPCAILDSAMLASFVQHWLAESLERLVMPLGTRSFNTHLSTADLLFLLWSGPAVALRRWNLLRPNWA